MVCPVPLDWVQWHWLVLSWCLQPVHRILHRCRWFCLGLVHHILLQHQHPSRSNCYSIIIHEFLRVHGLIRCSGPSKYGGMIGMASSLFPSGVMWSVRKCFSHMMCSSVESYFSVFRWGARHTSIRVWSLGKCKNLLEGRFGNAPLLLSLRLGHPRTTHFTIAKYM